MKLAQTYFVSLMCKHALDFSSQQLGNEGERVSMDQYGWRHSSKSPGNESTFLALCRAGLLKLGSSVNGKVKEVAGTLFNRSLPLAIRKRFQTSDLVA